MRFQVEDDETRFNTAYALNKLSVNEENIRIFGDSGFIPLLIDTVLTAGKDASAQAVATLRHLAMRVYIYHTPWKKRGKSQYLELTPENTLFLYRWKTAF